MPFGIQGALQKLLLQCIEQGKVEIIRAYIYSVHHEHTVTGI